MCKCGLRNIEFKLVRWTRLLSVSGQNTKQQVREEMKEVLASLRKNKKEEVHVK